MLRHPGGESALWLLSFCLWGWLGAVVQAEPQRFALVVGVREYPASEKLTPLAFTEPDANQLAATLKASGFRVTLMTQTASRSDGQQRVNPTAAFIRRQFAGLVGTPFLTEADCLLVILEGHGIQLPSKLDAGKFTFYFCAADALIDDLTFSEDVQEKHNLISVQELYDTLKPCGAGVKLLVVDACRNDPNKPELFRSVNSVTRPPVPTPPGGVAALFSCSASQRAAEDPALGHGVFTHFLLEALGGQGDLDGDRQIDITELHKYVGGRTYTHVWEKYGTRQLPEFKGEIQGWAPLLSVTKTAQPMPTVPTVTPTPQPPLDTFAGTKAGDLWDKNGLAMKFRWCPPGTFKMGSSESEITKLLQEHPLLERTYFDAEIQTTVTLTKGFWLGQYEVTQAEWKSIMDTAPWSGKSFSRESADYPANYISWEDANTFCVKLTAKGYREGWLPEGWKFDLPTEAQWEYACRAGTETRYSWGATESPSRSYAWTDRYDTEPGRNEHAHKIGQLRPNAWSLYDMHGNLSEWCRDWYVDDLPGGIDPDVQASSKYRVHRGGSWNIFNWHCRSAARSGHAPDDSSLNLDLGFRVALVPVSLEKPVSQTPVVAPTETFSGDKPGDLWDKNGLAMKFRWCPPGTFTMGLSASEIEAILKADSTVSSGYYADMAQVEVTLTRGFWLGQYEVTQGEWEDVMGTTVAQKAEQGTFRKDLAGLGPRYPMYYVNQAEALDFCRRLTERERQAKTLPEGWEFTLPTEAQWEYACRAGTKTATAFGDSLDNTQANFDGRKPYRATAGDKHPDCVVVVESYRPNPWNLHGMHGNVWELCRDIKGGKLPGGTDPDVQQWTPESKIDHRMPIIRGGGWDGAGWYCLSGYRGWKYYPDELVNNVGFRVALVRVSPEKPVSQAPVVVPAETLPGGKPGDLWDKNGLAMKFRWCPPGTFTMGSPENDPAAVRGEESTRVTLTRCFWLGQHEVTQQEWLKVMRYRGWKTADGSGFPATHINCEEALEFCRKLTAQERAAQRIPDGWEFTLPTEAQWEYACRAGTTTRYSFGDDPESNQLSAYACWGIKPQNDEPHYQQVGHLKPNSWNLYDMHGNVREWCQDWYSERLPGGTDPLVNQTREFTHRVCRGGSWNSTALECRCAARTPFDPDFRDTTVGFRVALVQVTPAAAVIRPESEPKKE